MNEVTKVSPGNFHPLLEWRCEWREIVSLSPVAAQTPLMTHVLIIIFACQLSLHPLSGRGITAVVTAGISGSPDPLLGLVTPVVIAPEATLFRGVTQLPRLHNAGSLVVL